MALRNVKIQATPQFADETLFTLIITTRSDDNAHDDVVATFPDLQGLGGVLTALAGWAEVFTAGGGNISWTFLGLAATAGFDFESGLPHA